VPLRARIDETTTPWEARYGLDLQLDKAISSGAISCQTEGAGVQRTLVGFADGDRQIAREVAPSCGTQPADRPRDQRVARAFLEKEHRHGLCPAAVECECDGNPVENSRKLAPARIVPTPFYKRPK